jgi:hypothetical protein
VRRVVLHPSAFVVWFDRAAQWHDLPLAVRDDRLSTATSILPHEPT